jgi:hypothetical protein
MFPFIHNQNYYTNSIIEYKPNSYILTENNMASSDDYESLPESMHPAIHMGAGALAGIGEHCIMYPADVVKV